MKRNILITTESLTMGGVETTLLSLLNLLSNYDINIDLYVLEEGVLKEEFKKYVNVNIIPFKRPKNKIINRVSKNLFCKYLIKKYQKNINKHYDVSIAFYGLNNYSDMYAAAMNADKKIIWIHNNFYELYNLSKYKFILIVRNKLLSKKYKYFDRIIPVSESSKIGFKKIFKGYDNKITVINNYINVKRIKEGAQEKIKLAGNPKIIVIGRLVKTKQIDRLIIQFEEVILRNNNAILYIIGDGPELDNLKQLVKNNNMNNNIKFLGNQNNPYKYMNIADIIVSASASETYSITLLEAMTLKKYFISVDNNGAKDVYQSINKSNSDNGMICKIENIGKVINEYLEKKDKIKPSFNMNSLNEEIEKQIKDLLEVKK